MRRLFGETSDARFLQVPAVFIPHVRCSYFTKYTDDGAGLEVGYHRLRDSGDFGAREIAGSRPEPPKVI